MEPDGSLPPPLVPILSQTNPVHTLTPYSLSTILLLPLHLRLVLPNGLFFSHFPTKILYVFLISTTRATCLAHLCFDVINFSEKAEAKLLLDSSAKKNSPNEVPVPNYHVFN